MSYTNMGQIKVGLRPPYHLQSCPSTAHQPRRDQSCSLHSAWPNPSTQHPARPLIAQIPIGLPSMSRFFRAHEGAEAGFPGLSFQCWRACTTGTHGANTPNYTSTPQSCCQSPAITCLLEDMLVSVLMLLVSVTTIAEGKREVWEYWGGSCLCAYTVEGETMSPTAFVQEQGRQTARYMHSCGDGYCADRNIIKEMEGNHHVPLA